MLIGILSSLLQLALLAAIGVAITRAVRARRDPRPADDAPGALRRLFLFGTLYATLHIAAWGVAGLLAAFADEPEASSGSRIGEPLAMTVVALPVLYLLGRWVMRTIADPAERTIAWSLYLNVTLLTSVGVAMITGIMTGSWLVGGASFQPVAVAALPIWAAIWAGHWHLWRSYRTEVSAAHIYLASAAGLATAASFAGVLLTHAMSVAMDAGTRLALMRFDGEGVRIALAGLVVGLGVWVWHWLVNGTHFERNVIWYAYTILFGVLAGLITVVVGAGISFFGLVQWWLGDPEQNSAVRHFFDFIPAVAASLIGATIWIYHRLVLQAGQRARTEVSRVYDYVVAGVGLVAATIGVVVLIIGLQQALFPAEVAEAEASSRNTLLAAITALLVGGPLWGQAWRRAGRHLRIDAAAETSSPTRRSYLFGILGVSGAVGLGSLLTLLTHLFNAFFDNPGSSLREDVRIPIALLVTVSVTAIYHWLVFREERTQVAVPARPKDVVLVTGSTGLADMLRRATGANVSVMLRLDINGETPGVEELAAAVEAAEHQRLLVLAGPSDRIEVVPLQQ
jgi:hypothetical protein